jgi:hypothetical protein
MYQEAFPDNPAFKEGSKKKDKKKAQPEAESVAQAQ